MKVIEINIPTADDPTRRAIVNEIYFALYKFGAPDELLAIVGSWGDTMDDAAPSIISGLSIATAH